MAVGYNSSLSMVFILLLTSVLCIESAELSTCWLRIDRHVCPRPSSYSNGATALGSVCYIKVTASIQLVKQIDLCGSIGSQQLYFLRDAESPELIVDPQNSTYNATTLIVTYDYNVTAERLIERLGGEVDNVSLWYVSRFKKCRSGWCSSGLKFVYDQKSKMKFQVLLDGATVAEGNMSNASSLTCTSTYSIGDVGAIKVTKQNIVNVSIDVVDPDVFDGESDMFEYSTISKLDVNLTAVVNYSLEQQPGNTSYNVITLAAPEWSIQNTSSCKSCELGTTNWCSSCNKLKENHAKVQYSFDVRGLSDFIYQVVVNGTKPKNSTNGTGFDAKVTLTFSAVVTSGRVNKQTCTHTVTFPMLIRAESTWSPERTTQSSERTYPDAENSNRIIVTVLCIVTITVALVAIGSVFIRQYRNRRLRKQQATALSECNVKLTLSDGTSEGHSTLATTDVAANCRLAEI